MNLNGTSRVARRRDVGLDRAVGQDPGPKVLALCGNVAPASSTRPGRSWRPPPIRARSSTLRLPGAPGTGALGEIAGAGRVPPGIAVVSGPFSTRRDVVDYHDSVVLFIPKLFAKGHLVKASSGCCARLRSKILPPGSGERYSLSRQGGGGAASPPPEACQNKEIAAKMHVG